MTAMNVQIFLGFVIAIGLVVNIEANCCKRNGPLCCGNGKCDMRCCNCDGGCNAHCERSGLTHCTHSELERCVRALHFCAGFCAATIEDPFCVACLGPMYLLCKKCHYGPGVDQQRALDDTKNIPYNLLLKHLLKVAEEKNKKG